MRCGQDSKTPCEHKAPVVFVNAPPIGTEATGTLRMAKRPSGTFYGPPGHSLAPDFCRGFGGLGDSDVPFVFTRGCRNEPHQSSPLGNVRLG